MSLNEWAKKEVEMLSKHSDQYLISCANAALEAFEVLLDQGHSGYSIGVTKRILNDLIDGKPLTAITGADDEWCDVWDRNGERGYVSQQNKRCSALFKHVYNDGRVEYSHNDRYTFYKNGDDIGWSCGYANKYLDEIFGKITMPFYPGPAIKLSSASVRTKSHQPLNIALVKNPLFFVYLLYIYYYYIKYKKKVGF